MPNYTNYGVTSQRPVTRDSLRARRCITCTYDPKFENISRAKTMRIHSVQIGRVLTEGDPRSSDSATSQWTTGFYKTPIAGPVQITKTSIQGDEVADTKNHGGPDKALLCYAASNYEAWASERPELGMGPGGFAENLTIQGACETTVCIGDRWRVGSCEFQVSQPRQPCWKISRRWGDKSLLKQVAQSGRTGWYLRVLQEGTLQQGDEIELTDQLYPDWTIEEANHVLFGRSADRGRTMELMNLPELADSWKKSIA